MDREQTHIPHYSAFVAGEWHTGTDTYEVRNPYNATHIGTVSRCGPQELEQATQAAVTAFATTRRMPTHQRATILRSIAESLTANAEDMAQTIAQETAKPIKQARGEVQRAIFTLAYAAEEATRIHDEMLHLDASSVGEHRQGIVRRFPIGPIAAISPFNFPLNLVAHKLAPAIAAGCPIVLKPASQTPISALKLARMIAEAGWPTGALSVLPLRSSDAAPLVEDERFKVLTFTGSPSVGWAMKNRAGRKRVMLELGGNAGVIIHDDADLAYAASRCVTGGFSHAGQSCISVQRIFIHNQIYQKFMSLFVPAVRALKTGDPLDEDTDLSVLITPAETHRIKEWLDEARNAGAEIVAGGTITDNILEPTIIRHATPDMRVSCQEVFAPVVTVQTYDDFDEALNAVNNSDFGLQAGVFTNNIQLIWHAYEELDVGGVIVNDVPTWRIDHMPYGGVKQSGFGREGVKYAIEEMTEPKLLVLHIGT